MVGCSKCRFLPLPFAEWCVVLDGMHHSAYNDDGVWVDLQMGILRGDFVLLRYAEVPVQGCRSLSYFNRIDSRIISSTSRRRPPSTCIPRVRIHKLTNTKYLKNTGSKGPDLISLVYRLLALVVGGATMIVNNNRGINNYLKIVEGIRLTMAALICLGVLDGRTFLSWLVLASTPLCVCAYPGGPKERIFGVALAFLPTVALLSVSYEPLFLITLTGHLLSWPLPQGKKLKVEAREKKTTLSIEDFAKAGFFVSF